MNVKINFQPWKKKKILRLYGYISLKWLLQNDSSKKQKKIFFNSVIFSIYFPYLKIMLTMHCEIEFILKYLRKMYFKKHNTKFFFNLKTEK